MSESPNICRLITRRQFIAGLGATVGVVAAGAYGISIWGRRDGGIAPTSTVSSPAANALPRGALGAGAEGRTLVVVEMGGGNDGLNTVVPHQDQNYHSLRGSLAIEDPLDLDGEIGLHPALSYVAERYGAGDVALVEGIGYPDPDLSHFASMAVWWTGAPGDAGANGWLGRFLDGVVGGEDPLAGITVGPGPTPALLSSQALIVSIQDMSGLTPLAAPWIDDASELVAMWSGFAPSGVDSPGLLGRVTAAISGTVVAARELGEALTMSSVPDVDRSGEADGAMGDRAMAGRRRGTVTDQLAVAARLIVSGLAPRVVYVHGFGDFDTHEGQVARHNQMMQDLDEGLAGFFAAVEAAGRGDQVVVATTSEFGRRVAFNGSGTDHGTAAAHMVLGAPVNGGRYGEPPDLGRLDQRGNPLHTVDFRSYYASLLDGWLAVDAETVLGSAYEIVPFLSQ